MWPDIYAVEQSCASFAVQSVQSVWRLNNCAGFPHTHPQGTGDSKVKGNNMSGNNAPHGNASQQCSACARVCSTVALLTSQLLAPKKEKTNKQFSLVICSESVLCLCLPGGGAGTAGFSAPEYWTCTVLSGNGCNTHFCWSTSWFGFLWDTEAFCGSGQKDWYHLPSCFSHELPDV